MAASSIWTPERLRLATDCAHQWKGTPHLNRRAISGVGIDCVHFVGQVLITAGIVPPFRFPYYNQAMGLRQSTNGLGSILEECFVGEWVEDPQDGDIVIFKVGFQSNHCGIVLGGECWHVATRKWVAPSSLRHVEKTTERIFRITGTGFKSRPENLHTQRHLKIR